MTYEQEILWLAGLLEGEGAARRAKTLALVEKAS